MDKAPVHGMEGEPGQACGVVAPGPPKLPPPIAVMRTESIPSRGPPVQVSFFCYKRTSHSSRTSKRSKQTSPRTSSGMQPPRPRPSPRKPEVAA